MFKRSLLAFVAAISLAFPALADWTGKDASGATITFKNPNTCSSVICVPITQLTDGTGAAIGVTGSPLFFAFGTGATLPAFASPPTVNIGTAPTIAVTGTFFQTTQPVSGTVTANQGTANTAANAWPHKITDGTNTAAVKAASTAPVATDPALVVSLSPNSAGITALGQNTRANSQPVTMASDQGTVGNVGADPSSGKGTPASVPINVSTATTTQLVALSGSTKIYVTSFNVVAAGTGNIEFVYGTGTACATGQNALTGNYNLTAQAGLAPGDGMAAVLVVPSGNALCVLTSAAVQMSGSVSYQQF